MQYLNSDQRAFRLKTLKGVNPEASLSALHIDKPIVGVGKSYLINRGAAQENLSLAAKRRGTNFAL